MGVRYSGRATIDPSNPRAVGVCDRCGFLYNLHALRYQPIYAGPKLLTTRLRVCDQCWDEPNPQMRTIRVPPDPWPVADPRVENFAVDEKNFLTLGTYVGRPSMFMAQSSMNVGLEHTSGLPPSMFMAQSALSAGLQLDTRLSAVIDGVSALSAGLQLDTRLSAVIDGVSTFNVDLLLVTLTTLTQQASATSQDVTITLPSGIQTGDLIVLKDAAYSSSSTIPTTVVPTGFTSINNVSNDADGIQVRGILSYKIATGSESSAVITGMDGGTGERKEVYVFRGDKAIVSVSVGSPAGQATNEDPSSQLVTSGSGIPPFVVIGSYFCATGPVDPRSFSPAKNGEISANTNSYLAYRIYNSSPSNVFINMDDEGSGNILQSCYLQCD